MRDRVETLFCVKKNGQQEAHKVRSRLVDKFVSHFGGSEYRYIGRISRIDGIACCSTVLSEEDSENSDNQCGRFFAQENF